MEKIKIIDLLNKIANGEDIPREIDYENIKWKRNREFNDYERDNGEYLFDDYLCFCQDTLNDEVKIIGEEKEIEPLNKMMVLRNGNENESMLFSYCTDLSRKLREVIEVVNELKRGN